MNIDLNDSIFDKEDHRIYYDSYKSKIMKEFNEENPNITFDFEKKVYLDEISQFIYQIYDAFSQGKVTIFHDRMTKIAYLALLKEEYQLASKIYNIMGHAYIYWKKPRIAY